MTQIPNSKSCFVCGLDNPNGLRLTFHSGEDHVWAEFIPQSWMVGYENVIHGGLISTVLDEVVIWTAFQSTGRFAVTAELKVRFRKPLHLGDRVTVQGKFKEDRSRLWIVTAEMIHQEGYKIADAEARLMPLNQQESDALRQALYS